MQTPLSAKRGSQRGLTLIELLVSMIIMTVISTMLIGGWISLQRSYAFTVRTNTARATARDAMDRVSSDLRAAQPLSAAGTTPFYFAGSTPYVCDATHCTFYSAYNNSAAASGNGFDRVRLTAIWLDSTTRTLYWQRDTSPSPTSDGVLTAADKKIVLARNVVNAALSPTKPVFIYYFRNPTTGVYSDSVNSPVTTFNSASVANLISVQIELVVDANLAHTPTYVDLKTTVRPRNAAATN